ncbi:hypothetical protein [Acetobacter okinawensis]|uniref:hypothetical protein n=1 Tax=Acetobacter okinawensis TaxID=1076594 RepID=UPI00131F22A1|nr:hypothetical protein [Acetobacter okinawensis]
MPASVPATYLRMRDGGCGGTPPYTRNIIILSVIYLTTLTFRLLKQITFFFDNKKSRKAYRMPDKA